MGAWGTSSFDNDDAADFLAEVIDSSNLTWIREIFANVIATNEYLEVPEASQAIAGAEVVAAALGRPTNIARDHDELAGWLVRVKPNVDPDLAAQASRALDRVLAPNSELRMLWEESHKFSEWLSKVTALQSQLRV